jgi:hypothetical protein
MPSKLNCMTKFLAKNLTLIFKFAFKNVKRLVSFYKILCIRNSIKDDYSLKKLLGSGSSSVSQR